MLIENCSSVGNRNMNEFLNWRSIAVIGTLVVLFGCGDEQNRCVIVKGKITYAGQPIEDGRVRFVPQLNTPRGTSFALIRQGEYRCDYRGGVSVGRHRVEIVAFDPNDHSLGGPGVPPRRQLIPSKYNDKSELTITIADGSKEAVQDFTLSE